MENKRKATFEHSIDVLVKAYLNNTLRHADCCGCAVGNLIADGLGCSVMLPKSIYESMSWDKYPGYYPGDSSKHTGWASIFVSERHRKKQIIRPENYTGFAKEQIDSTGYSWKELALIERAFEKANKVGGTIDEMMFNGLMNVVDVLAKIHEIDLETKESTKKLFNKELQLN